MALFTSLLLPPTLPQPLPLLTFYQDLLRVPTQPLALTLAGITLGLLLLRRLDGRPAPLLFRAAAVLTAALTLAALTGLVGWPAPLATATGGVLLLLLDEAINLLEGTIQLFGAAGTELVGDARRLLARRSPKPEPDAAGNPG